MKSRDTLLLEKAYNQVAENFLSKLNPFAKKQTKQQTKQPDPENNIGDWLESMGLHFFSDTTPAGWYETSWSYPGKGEVISYSNGKWHIGDGKTLDDDASVKKYVTDFLNRIKGSSEQSSNLESQN